MTTSILNKYTLVARFFPTVLCIIPFLILQYFFLNKEMLDFLNYLGSLKLIGNITLTVIVLYLLSQINRLIGKDFFERIYFKEELSMPTTEFLLFSNNQYSNEYKHKIHQRIKTDFRINLENERDDENASRKKIVEAVSLIRKKVGKGTLLFQHNIEYGFLRNLIGGSVIALIISSVNIYFTLKIDNTPLLTISIILSLIYLLLIVFSKYIIEQSGKKYAKILFQEYMGASK